MTWDWRTFGLAVVLELVLLALAAFGGPHGALGAWPWMLQIPGILLVYAVPGESLLLGRVAVGALIQVALWYLVIGVARRRRRRANAT